MTKHQTHSYLVNAMNIKFSLIIFIYIITIGLSCAEQAATAAPTTEIDNASKSAPATSPEINNKDTLGIHIGYTHDAISDFEITDTNEANADNKVKANFRGTNQSPLLLIRTGNLVPRDLDWQLVIEAGYSEFNLHKQETDRGEVDFGTSVKGEHIYIMPQVFYSTSGIGVHPNKEHGLHLGAGIGISLLKATGTAVYTDPKTQASATPDEVHEINVNALGGSMKLFAEYRYYGLFASTQIKAVIVEDEDMNNNKYMYTLFDVGVSLGYSLYF